MCSTDNVDLVRSLGAARVVDYTKQDVTGLERRYDVVFQLGGTASPWRLRNLLKDGGTLVLCSGSGRLSGIDRILQAALVSRLARRRMVTWVAGEAREDLLVLADLLADGRIAPVVGRTCSLAEVPEAIRQVEGEHTRGKIVVDLG